MREDDAGQGDSIGNFDLEMDKYVPIGVLFRSLHARS